MGVDGKRADGLDGDIGPSAELTKVAARRELDQMPVVRFSRNLVARSLVAALILLWPFMLFGAPAYFVDSISYYKGGRAAVSFVRHVPSNVGPAAAGSALGPPHSRAEDAPAQDSKGARSIIYSVLAYMLSAPGTSMTLLIGLQALLAGLIVIILVDIAGPLSLGRSIGVVAGLAGLSPIACFVCFAMPDIFAGLLIVGIATLAVAADRFSAAVRWAIVAIAALAITSHASHLPVAAGMAITSGAWLAWRRPTGWRSRTVLLASPLLLGSVATLVSGLIGFGTVSFAPKRFPLTLARSIEDGPGRWYLERACARPRYAVCEVFGTHFPDTVPGFLWGTHGLTGRASPEQMDRIRQEEAEIVLAAGRAYPAAQLRQVTANILGQLSHINLDGVDFSHRIVLDARAAPRFVAAPARYTAVLQMLGSLSVVSALLGSVVVALLLPRLARDQRALIGLLAIGILGNAVVCALFSGVADRYQARVIWIVPLIASILLLRRAAEMIGAHEISPEKFGK